MKTEQLNPVINNRFFKPQHEWGWQVALYLYLAGMGAGSLVIGLLMDWTGVSPYAIRAILLWGAVLVPAGAAFLVLKLSQKLRFWRAILNPRSSWLSRGFYILSVCMITGIIILGISLLSFFDIDVSAFAWLIKILDIIVFIFSLSTAVYTGILIMSVKYVSFWHTWLLPALFTVSALSTGSMLIVVSTYAYDMVFHSIGYSADMMHLIVSIEQMLLAVEAVVLAVYLYSRYKTSGQGKPSVRLLMFGKLKYIFWVGVVVLGFVLPVILEVLYSNLPENPYLLFATGASALLGGFFVRFGIIYAGIKDQTPLQKFTEVQYYLKYPGRQMKELFDAVAAPDEETL